MFLRGTNSTGGKLDFGTAAELKWVGNTPSTKIKATTLRQKAQRVARPPAAAQPPAFSAAFLVWKAAFHSSPEIEKPASNFTTKLPRSDRKHRGTALGHHQVSTLDFSNLSLTSLVTTTPQPTTQSRSQPRSPTHGSITPPGLGTGAWFRLPHKPQRGLWQSAARAKQGRGRHGSARPTRTGSESNHPWQ